MGSTHTEPPSLQVGYCRDRQESLRGMLRDMKLDAALLTHRHYVYWVTGYWHPLALTPVVVFVPRDGPVALVTHSKELPETAAEEVIIYRPHKLCTLIENLNVAVTSQLRPKLQGMRQVGTDGVAFPWLNDLTNWIDLTTEFQMLRRKKYPDEVDTICYSIVATEAAYAKAREIMQPGVSEIDLFASMHAAATLAAGEPLSGWGNDFQSGTAGGLPRRRNAVAGELAILDIGVGVRGYRSDLCRTFAVSGSPGDLQQEAQQRIVAALEMIEHTMRPGLNCSELFATMLEYLDGWKGYSFFHHLGHGIGLDGHEVPRLNPHWNDTFQVGDLVAVEPGLYGEPLRGGVRLEQDYLVTESGTRRLSNFPLDL